MRDMRLSDVVHDHSGYREVGACHVNSQFLVAWRSLDGNRYARADFALDKIVNGSDIFANDVGSIDPHYDIAAFETGLLCRCAGDGGFNYDLFRFGVLLNVNADAARGAA